VVHAVAQSAGRELSDGRGESDLQRLLLRGQAGVWRAFGRAGMPPTTTVDRVRAGA
jgi:hypothetical protein